MKRLKLLLGMIVLSAVLVAAVVYGSPYAPVVAPVMDIEEIWAIEDARQESETPLVTALENGGMPLGYDALENTFCCTLGMGLEDTWPEIHLTAPGAEGVELVFVDDYSYDWCADAIRDSYTYQILAYTDTEFSYTQVVFTSLPIITLSAGQYITPQIDVPADVTISWPGEAPVRQAGRAHRRGATSLEMTPKNGFKVEFTRGLGGGKCEIDVPKLGRTDYMTLLSLSIDPLMIRDKLSWDMYNAYMDESRPFGHMEAHFVELFVDNDYHGVYLYMQAYDHAEELAKESRDAVMNDSFYRLIDRTNVVVTRPIIRDHETTGYEQFYAPQSETDFQSIRPFIEMLAIEDDAAFCKRAMELLDLDSLIRYALFIEACGMMDNEYNNLCIWAHRDGGTVRYAFAPWDLDVSWGVDDGRNSEIWYTFQLFNRLLRTDCGGVMRTRTQEIWQEMRELAFNEANIERLMTQYDQELNNSGAFYRNAVRWVRNTEFLDTYEVFAYAVSRFDMMDRRIEEIAGETFEGRQIEVDFHETRDAGELDAHMSGLE